MSFYDLVEWINPVLLFFRDMWSCLPPMILLLGTSVFGIFLFVFAVRMFRR